MALRVEMVREAEDDLVSAASFYEAQRRGLALRFIAAVERVVAFSAEQPLTGAPLGSAIRRHLVPGFPYAVIYETNRDAVRVLAIAHLRRHPAFWIDRE
ncbi:MAG: type II toxin-antitoxin system RelE/ParE family toxin [Gemmatimonadaceae bacterium]